MMTDTVEAHELLVGDVIVDSTGNLDVMDVEERRDGGIAVTVTEQQFVGHWVFDPADLVRIISRGESEDTGTNGDSRPADSGICGGVA